jgi:hypothetical protein
MHTIARFSVGLLVSFVVAPISTYAQSTARDGAASIASLEEFGEFSQTYYSGPRPDLIPAALAFLDTSALISNPDRAPLVMMSLSCILHRPELKGRSWDAELAKLHEPARGVIQQAIFTEPDALLAKLPISPGRNDMNWACFFGSGEERYLDHIVEMLAYVDERQDPNAFLTGASAQWSLSSNARAHDEVKAKLERLRARKGPLQKIAAETLAKSPDQIRSETTAVMKAQHQRGAW